MDLEKYKSRCRFYCNKINYPNECRNTTYHECLPMTCPWYQTQDEWEASILNAARIARKNGDRYFDAWIEKQPDGHFKSMVYKTLRKAGYWI